MEQNSRNKAFYERMRKLSDIKSINENKNEVSTGTLVETVQAADGSVYGIIKENHKFFIKKSTGKNKENLNESHFVYINGLENKSDYRYDNLAEAEKQMNMFVKNLNEAFSFEQAKKEKEPVKEVINENKETVNEDKKPDDVFTFLREKIDTGKLKKSKLNEDNFKKEYSKNQINEAEDVETDIEAADKAMDSIENIPANEPEKPVEEPTAEEKPEETPAEEPAAEEEPKTDEETPEETPEEEPKGGEEKEENGDDLLAKEVQKLVGKLGEKVRNIDLTPEQTKSAMNSVIAAFKNELGDVEVEDRKEMSDKILKSQGGSESESGEEGESLASGIDKESEKAIDDKIKELQTNETEKPMEEEKCVECTTFESYLKEMGYGPDELEECSEMEMGNLISGYANAYNDGMNDGDFDVVAIYVSPNVLKELGEYGHDEYIEKLKPSMDKVDEGAKKSYKGFEPTLSEDFDVEDEMGTEELPVEEPAAEETPEIGFAAPAEVMGGGVPKPDSAKTKTVDVDLENQKVSMTVSESESKVRQYILNRIEEKFNGKKSMINEDVKSEKIKHIDKIIDENIKLYENQINEIFGFSNAEKFEKLDANNDQEIEQVFNKVFENILRNKKMGIIGRMASKTPVDKKYEILKTGYDTDKLQGTLRIENNELVYAPKDVKSKAQKSDFTSGGTAGKTSLGGV